MNRQDSLTSQMSSVVKLATDNGCYDAADWILKTFWKVSSQNVQDVSKENVTKCYNGNHDKDSLGVCNTCKVIKA